LATPDHQPGPDTRRRSRANRLLTGAALVVAAVLAFTGLGDNRFWDDEANTALFARNLLTNGELTGWDGTNLVGFRGGAELDENLINVYMPPLQYYVAAAGFLLLGEGTVAGRVPFVIIGLLGLLAVAVLARNLLGERFPWWVAPALLAVSPAYLLYIRNCRYYALGALFSVVLLAAFTSRIDTTRRLWAAAAVAAVATAGLMLTNYFYAASSLVAMLVLLLHARYRTRHHAVVIGVACAAAALIGAWVLTAMSPFGSDVLREDSTPAVERLFTLLRWHLAGIGTFEFFPVLLIAVLLAPFYSVRLRVQRPLALEGLVVVLAGLAMVAVTVAFSPQPVSKSLVADMRYLVPLIPLGAIPAGAALVLVWRTLRPLAIAIAALVVLTNVPHLGFLGGFNGFLEPRGATCTLCLYAREITVGDRTTVSEAVIDHLADFPPDAELFVHPGYMAYPAMFYLPDREFCCQIDEQHPLRDDLRAALPDRVFWERAAPDRGLINDKPPPANEGPLTILGHRLGVYRIYGVLDLPSKDCSRPEIPWHAFVADEVRSSPHFPYLIVELSR